MLGVTTASTSGTYARRAYVSQSMVSRSSQKERSRRNHRLLGLGWPAWSLATCSVKISASSTARMFSLSMRRSIPLETATRALFRLMPVANAFMSSEGNMATSGIPMLALEASSPIVLTSQRSVSLAGEVITCALVSLFALHFESARLINAPPIPKTAENMRSD